MTQVRELLAANIKAERRRLGITQERLAELADLSAQMVHDIEGGRSWVSDKSLQSLADALGIPVSRLFTAPDSAPETPNTLRVKTLWQNIKLDVDRRLDEWLGA